MFELLYPNSDHRYFQERMGRHWAKNANNCYSCDDSFRMLLRQHHCRQCGEIFCYRCSSLIVDNRRACAFCFVNSKNKSLDNLSDAVRNSGNRCKKSRISSQDSEPSSERATVQSFRYTNSQVSNPEIDLLSDRGSMISLISETESHKSIVVHRPQISLIGISSVRIKSSKNEVVENISK